MTVVKTKATLDIMRFEYGQMDKKAVLVERLKRDIRWRQRSTADDFLYSNDFMRYFVEFVNVQTLMKLRLLDTEWNGVADALINDGVRSGEIIVHAGKDISEEKADALEGRRKLVTRVIFLLNITKVGELACGLAANLVVVDIPEGVESISDAAFCCCASLTTVSFPTTLRSIGRDAFLCCTSLDNVDLLHTNLQELGFAAFINCSELKSMTIPDSLQKFGYDIFLKCSKLVPSYIFYTIYDATFQIVAQLRFQQSDKTFLEHYANLIST